MRVERRRKVLARMLTVLLALVAAACGQTVSSGPSPSPPPGPTGPAYYVDNCVVVGSDSNKGTSPSAPWLTIHKVNTATFNPGDSILFESTCTWREQLTVPSSGSAGSPITFGAYGTGAQPIISGADLLTSWASEAPWYYAPAAAQPNQVFRDNQRLTLAASQAALATGQWWWDSTNKRVYVYDDPSGHTMEASQRNYGILVSSKNYVTIQGLTIAKTNSSGILFITSSNAVVTQSTITDTAGYGIQDATTSCNGFSFSYNTVSHTGDNGIGTYGCNNGAIYRNDVSHSGMLVDDRTGISIFGGFGNSVYQNVSHDHTDQTGPVGIRGFILDTVESLGPNYLYQNIAYNCNGTGIMAWNSQNQQIYYNLSYNNPAGTDIYNKGFADQGYAGHYNSGNVWYGNTAYNNAFANFFVSYVTSSTWKNNISQGSQYGFDQSDNLSGMVTDYNLVNGASSNLYNVTGTGYSSAAAYYAATGNGQHDKTGSPNFANASAGQFWLTSGSPGIDAGVNLGSPYNLGLLPASSWPNSVLPGDQNSYGTGWEIGAYIFTGQTVQGVLSGRRTTGTSSTLAVI